MQSIDKINSFSTFIWDKNSREKLISNSESKVDSIEISNTAKVYDKVDKFLNLGATDRLDVGELNDSEKEEFLKMLATLIKKGIVGYEIREVNGKPERHFLDTQIGDERIKGARLYKKKDYYILRK